MKLNDKSILVTGAAGTVGRLFLHGLVEDGFNGKIYALDKDETKLVILQERLREYNNVNYVLADISDNDFLKRMFTSFQFDVIVHCAAYKHVSFLENQVYAAVRNNVIALYELLNLCFAHKNASHFLFISSDKAVNPVNVMGKTKRVGELLVQHFDQRSESCRFSFVRFNNVFDSNGSVLQLFKEQYQKHHQIYVTCLESSRFFVKKENVYQIINQSLKSKKSSLLGRSDFEMSLRDLVTIFFKENELEFSAKNIKEIGQNIFEKDREELYFEFEKVKDIPGFNRIESIVTEVLPNNEIEYKAQEIDENWNNSKMIKVLDEMLSLTKTNS